MSGPIVAGGFKQNRKQNRHGPPGNFAPARPGYCLCICSTLNFAQKKHGRKMQVNLLKKHDGASNLMFCSGQREQSHNVTVNHQKWMDGRLSNTWSHLPTTTNDNDNQWHVCPATVSPQCPKLHSVLQAAQFRLSRSTIIAAPRTASLTFWHRCVSILWPLKRSS